MEKHAFKIFFAWSHSILFQGLLIHSFFTFISLPFFSDNHWSNLFFIGISLLPAINYLILFIYLSIIYIPPIYRHGILHLPNRLTVKRLARRLNISVRSAAFFLCVEHTLGFRVQQGKRFYRHISRPKAPFE